MVRGIFFKCDFSLAHYATDTITANLLYPIVWEGVQLIENCGLRVIAITADGPAQIVE